MNYTKGIWDMINRFLLLPLILDGLSTAPVTDPPAHAFELEIEERHWNNVYRAIEYIKQGVSKREKKMTDPSDAINSALAEYNYGSNDTTEQEE